MKDSARSKRSITPAGFRDSAGVVAWALGAYAIVQLIARMFFQNLTGAIAVEAFAAEMVAGKVDVAWSDPEDTTAHSEKAIALRAARGALAGMIAAAVAFGALHFHGATFLAGRASFASAAFGLLTAGLTAVRDELLLRGFVIRAFRKIMPVPLLLAVCGLAGAAARMSDPTAGSIEIVSSAALAVAFGSAWLVDRGAWMAWGAHAAWIWSTSTLGRGVFFDAKIAASSLEGDAFAAGALTIVALASAAFSASRTRGVRIASDTGMNGQAHE